MLCFNSSDPAAANASVVFDMKDDEGNLWIRSSEDVPLSSCASSSPPLVSQCTVCLERIVYAVCRNLTDGVDVTMEAGTEPIKISKSKCPELRTDDAPLWPLPVAIAFVAIIIAIIITVVVYLRRRRSNNQKQQSEGEQDAKENHSPFIPGANP